MRCRLFEMQHDAKPTRAQRGLRDRRLFGDVAVDPGRQKRRQGIEDLVGYLFGEIDGLGTGMSR